MRTTAAMAGREYHAMSNKNKLSIYVSDAKMARLEREADDADMSLSAYASTLIDRQWQREDTDEAAQELGAEEKVEQIVADAKDELVGIARDVEQRNEDVADMTARAGSYSIANFELLKDEFDPAEARKAQTLLTGSRRLREPLEEHPDRDLDVDPDDPDETDEDGESDEDGPRNIIEELRDDPEREARKKRQRVKRDHAYARRELRKRKRREEKERNSGLSGLFR
jgi:hypothetical protein